jgi:hypothetical protein
MTIPASSASTQSAGSESAKIQGRRVRSAFIGVAAGVVTLTAAPAVSRLAGRHPSPALQPTGEPSGAISLLLPISSGTLVHLAVGAFVLVLLGLGVVAALLLPAVWSRHPERRAAALTLVTVLLGRTASTGVPTTATSSLPARPAPDGRRWWRWWSRNR